MSFQTYDLDSSDSSDPIPQKPQKKSKKFAQGYSNDPLRKNNSKLLPDSDDFEKAQPQESPKKSNKTKKSILIQKNQFDIQDSDDDEINDNSKNTSKYSKPDKKAGIKKKFNSDYENNDSEYSQKNSAYADESNQAKSRAYSYGKSHKNIDPGLLNFDLSDNDEDQKQKSPYSDSNSRSSTKYSKTIGGGENSLSFRSKDFSPKSKGQTKNVIRTNDFSSNRNKKSDKVQHNKPNQLYSNYDSDGDSYDDQDYNKNISNTNGRIKKSNIKNMNNLTDSDNGSPRKKVDRRKIEKEKAKESSSSSLNDNSDWSFPMKYVPEPDDMKEIIEDYHDKYSIDFLLRRIINNPSCRSSNDE